MRRRNFLGLFAAAPAAAFGMKADATPTQPTYKGVPLVFEPSFTEPLANPWRPIDHFPALGCG
jgi:hypothetical protein